MNNILNELSDELRLDEKKYSIDDLIGKSRKQEIVTLRFKAYFLARAKGLTLAQIGALFNRDHAQVLYGIRMFVIAHEHSSLFNLDVTKLLAEKRKHHQERIRFHQKELADLIEIEGQYEL